MARLFEQIDDTLAAWIHRQQMFFVATAPLSAEGQKQAEALAQAFAVLPGEIELVDPAPEGVAATLRYVGRTVMEPAGIGGWLGATLRDFEIAVSNPGGSSSGDTGDTGDDGNGGSTHYDYSGDDDLGYDDGRFGGCDCRGGDAGSRGGPGWALLLLLAWPRRRRPRAPRRG